MFSDGIPVSRPRARLIAARSSGRPSRLLRSASVTNSSISLPTWRVMPRMIAPAATSASWSMLAKASGFKNAWIRPIGAGSPSSLTKTCWNCGSSTSICSVSIECPKRYTTCANSATIEGSISVW
ncbi:hypothetical protein D3C73_555700 [compost metagenome]